MSKRLSAVLACTLALLPATGSPVAAAVPRISIDIRDADIVDVLRLLATEADASIIADDSVKHDKVTLHLRNVTFMEALSVLAHAYDLQVRNEDDVLIVGSSASMNRKYGDDMGGLGAQTVVIAVQNASPDDLVKPLSDALEPGTVVVADKRTGSLIITGDAPSIVRARRLVAALDAPLASNAGIPENAIRLRYIKPDDAIKQLKGILPDDAYSAASDGNTVFINGPVALLSTARALISAIDVPAPQVMFEVRVVDVSTNNMSDVGALFGGVPQTPSNVLGTQSPQLFSYQITPFINKTVGAFAQLKTMISDGSARLLATPRVATLNNQEASILIGSQYPVITETSTNAGQNASVNYIEIGVKLRFTPTIGSDGSITAELHPELSSFTQTVSGGGVTAPIIDTRRVDTTLRIQKDETVVLAGLLQDTDTTTITKFPFLGDIPVLGELFKERAHTHNKDDVVFLITPHIMP